MNYKGFFNSPIGIIKITACEDKIDTLEFVDYREDDKLNTILHKCLNQLEEYFKGTRKEFDLDLEIKGTPFQVKVWENVRKIPYGDTATYKDIALILGNRAYSRAVGNANNKNKIPIIIPCHRVIGVKNRIGGYSCGIEKKEWLLRFETKTIFKINV